MNTIKLGRTSRKTLLLLLLLLLIPRLGGLATAAKESVRAELARLQRSLGLALVAVSGSSIEIVSFEGRNLRTKSIEGGVRPVGSIDGTMSPDGSRVALAAFSPEATRQLSDDYLVIWAVVDSNSVREYPDLRNPEEFCWSRDAKSLAFRGKRVEKLANKMTQGLFVLNVPTGEINFIDPLGRVTTSCWSPDADSIAYSAEDEVRVSNLRENKSKVLTKGAGPIWSPDGRWIAYAEGDSYWLTSPTSSDRKLLFRNKRAFGLLGWSPDSRFVAYLSRPSFFESLGAKMEEHRLWVRRIEDGDEAWVYRYTGKSGSVRWHWVTNVFTRPNNVTSGKSHQQDGPHKPPWPVGHALRILREGLTKLNELSGEKWLHWMDWNPHCGRPLNLMEGAFHAPKQGLPLTSPSFCTTVSEKILPLSEP